MPRAPTALNVKVIEHAKAINDETGLPQNRKLFDGGGLHLAVMISGGKLWRLKYIVNGKEKILSLGKFPDVTLAEARELRDENRKLIARGIDPSLLKAQEKIKRATHADTTFFAVSEDWLVIRAKTLAPSTHKKILQTFMANVYPHLGKLPIGEIIYEQIRRVIQIMQKRGAIEYSMKTREWIAAIFEFAVSDGLIENSPIKGNDARLEKPKNARMPHLKTMEDAGEFLRGVADYGGTFETQSFAFIMLNVAQRPSELRCAKWTEFNMLKKVWTLPIERSKTRQHMAQAHTIMLSEQVIEALKKLHEFSGHSEYLFSSTRASGKPISEATARKVFRECFAGYHHVPHGARHFFSTEANNSLKFHKDVIEATLGHGDQDQIRGRYNLAQYEESRRELAQWWSNQLEVAQFGALVLPFVAAKN